MSGVGYFPYRTCKNRPYIADFLSMPDKKRKWDSLVSMALFATRKSFGGREKINADHELGQHVHACCINESWLATALADFFNGGQVVLHISSALKEAFRYSDLGDATARDLRLPFNDSYIHIGADVGLEFNAGQAKLEGVFLSENDDKDGKSLSITLVGELKKEVEHWGERGMESFTLHFSNKMLDVKILEGAQMELERLSADPEEDGRFSDLSQFDEESKNRILESWSKQAELRRLHRENIPVVLECVRMVSNALLYISQYPDDMEDDFQDGFPAGFREKIERSQGKMLERVLSKARSSGFTKIKRVGGSFERAMLIEESASGIDKLSPSPHLRRAHWRRQAFGSGLSQRKLIWIRATRVLGGSVRERPYLISEPSLDV